MINNEDKNQKPLTLDMLADYSQQVLLPAMDERFVAKQDFNQFKQDFNQLKDDFNEFKDENLTGQDTILKKLELLLDEKEVREYQEKKEKELWAIVIKALKEHGVLSSKELENIARLEIF